MINPTGYEQFDPPRVVNPKAWTRPEAREYFRSFVAQIPERLRQLQIIIGASDWDCALDYSASSLDCVGAFLSAATQVRPKTKEETAFQEAMLPEHFRDLPLIPRIFHDLTLSLCVDVGIYLCETIRTHRPELKWILWTRGKLSICYQEPVLGGFAGQRCVSPNVDWLARDAATNHPQPGGLREQFEHWIRSPVGETRRRAKPSDAPHPV